MKSLNILRIAAPISFIQLQLNIFEVSELKLNQLLSLIKSGINFSSKALTAVLLDPQSHLTSEKERRCSCWWPSHV